MKSILTAVLAAVLSLPSLAVASDDHTMNDVRAMLGNPSDFRSATCGGMPDVEGNIIPKWPCTTWTYKSEHGSLEVYFNTTTKRFATVGGFHPDGSPVSYTAGQEALSRMHGLLHEAREEMARHK